MDLLYDIELEAIGSYELRDMNKNNGYPKYPNLKKIFQMNYMKVSDMIYYNN